jgi:hypothetical protein
MPIPPIGDIACAASAMRSKRSRHHFLAGRGNGQQFDVFAGGVYSGQMLHFSCDLRALGYEELADKDAGDMAQQAIFKL